MSDSSTRREALKQILVLPALAAAFAVGAGSIADAAANNQKQFKYQSTPGKGGAKCSGCRFFKAPKSCSIVTGTISPNGWCIAWAKK